MKLHFHYPEQLAEITVVATRCKKLGTAEFTAIKPVTRVCLRISSDSIIYLIYQEQRVNRKKCDKELNI